MLITQAFPQDEEEYLACVPLQQSGGMRKNPLIEVSLYKVFYHMQT
ncbi:hypothetical protein [Lysinibacillus pakistanensis]